MSRLSERFGAWLNGLRLHTVRRRSDLPGAPFEKRRRAFASPFLLAVNGYLTASGLDVRFLRGASWADWEVRLHAAVNGEGGTIHRRAVRLARVPGVSVDRIVRDPRTSPDRRIAVVSAAAEALAALHRVVVERAPSGAWSLSHGGAVLRNVLFDAHEDRARWIDFETRHRRGAPHRHRRADDVWTFARSAVAHLGPVWVPQVARIVRRSLLDADLRAALVEVLARERPGAGLFRLAQAPIPARATCELAALLLAPDDAPATRVPEAARPTSAAPTRTR